MKNKRLTALAALAVAILFLLALVYYLRQEQIVVSPSDNHVKLMPTIEMTPGPEITEKIPLNPKLSRKLLKHHLTKPSTELFQVEHQKRQLTMIKKFKNTVKLEMNFPVTMEYFTMDMEEDNIAGIYGSTQSGDRQFAVLATNRLVSVDEVVSYLNASREAFPLLKGRRLKSRDALTIDAPEETGLQDLVIIPTTKVNGKDAYAALAKRKDGQGTYLFMMEAPADYFDKNEGGLELMLKSIKTQK